MAAIRFCGCSVTGFSCRLGWGQNKSSLDVEVVEDSRNADFFNPPGLGQPCYFYFGPNFYFWGILQNYDKQQGRGGLQLFKLRVEDPREILAGTQLIINTYNGSTYGVPNILNCYGYLENLLGYGGAQVNEGGMPWVNILRSINDLTALPAQSNMGGPLSFMGVNYTVDLSNLPVPPVYYRLSGGPNITLLDAIQQICDDGGCDFFVELQPGTRMPVIKIYTVSRYNQPPLGTISSLVNTNWGGTVVRSNNGLELRNEPTTHFLVGGKQQNLYETDALQPFWGYDSNGLPVQNMIINIPGLGFCNAAYIEASEVADSFNNGATTYFLTEFEMRAVLNQTPGTWEQYVTYETLMMPNINNLKANIIGPLGMKAVTGIPANQQAAVVAELLLGNPTSNDAQNNAQEKLKQFVLRKAQNWYGRKYWVSLPFVTSSTDQETGIITASQEISDGGWLPQGATPLGLYAESIQQFQTDDGRYEALAVYQPGSLDLTEAQSQDSIKQDNGFFTKIQIDHTIVAWPQTGIPSCVVTVNNPVNAITLHIGGDIPFLQQIFNQKGDIWQNLQGNKAWGAIDMIIAPPRIDPTAFAIPLKSNIATYGPWYFAGAPGRVNVEQAADLTPWEYGSWDLMNLAANARVTSAVTFMQQSESGMIELVGMPMIPLGRRLIVGGPDTTNIEVKFGPQGITTTYQFRTFTELHLNRFIRSTQEHVKRLARTQNELRKLVLTGLEGVKTASQTIEKSQSAFIPRNKWQISWSSPQPVIIASALQDSNKNTLVGVATVAPDEGWAGIGGMNPMASGLFVNSALTGLSALLRPFANNPASITSTLLPKITVPDNVARLTQYALNPYSYPADNDLDYLIGGDNAQGTGVGYLPRQGIDWNNVRGIGLRMPMMCVGWGVDINGQFTPFDSPHHKAGPMDPLWDMNRGVWTSHDLVFGVLTQNCPPAGSGLMTIDSTNNLKMYVKNSFGTQVNANTKVMAGYFPYSNDWKLIAADCVS